MQIKCAVESLVYESDGKQLITLHSMIQNCSKSYLFCGWTRNHKVILYEMVENDPTQMIKHFGKVSDGKLFVEGHRFSVVLPPMENVII